jgi:hypothetical protein
MHRWGARQERKTSRLCVVQEIHLRFPCLVQQLPVRLCIAGVNLVKEINNLRGTGANRAIVKEIQHGCKGRIKRRQEKKT